LKNHKVLLVDDDRTFLEAVRMIYEHHSFDVIEAYDGKSVFSEAKKHQPDLIVLDVMLPVMDGYSVCFKLKNDDTTVNIPVIILTSLGAKSQGLNGAEIIASGHGANLYLEKPIEPEILYQKSMALVEEFQSQKHTKNRILIIDDDVDFADAIKNAFNHDQYEILLSHSGEEGMRTAKKEKPDLILLDVMLPEIDGYKVCKQLKENNDTRSIPIILLTSVGSKLTKPGYAEAIAVTHQADDYIQKPVETKELIKRIQNLIGPRRRLV
jgi:DNA-binding response OmpR family regulator